MPGPNEDAQPLREDPKDFVEQLRLIHFTQVMTCLALVVIALSPPSNLIQKANEQLRQIRQIATSDIWGATLVQSSQKRAVMNPNIPWRGTLPDKPLCPVGTIEMQQVDIGDEVIELQFDQTPFLRELDSGILALGSTGWGITAPATLEEFRKIWDAKLRLACPTTLALKGKLQLIAAPPRDIDLRPPLLLAPSELKQFQEKLSQRKAQQPTPIFVQKGTEPNLWAIPKNQLAFVTYITQGSLVLPIEQSTEIPLDLRTELREKARQSWPEAEFRQAFYELDQATSGLQRLSLEDLAPILEQQEKKTKENFEAFGIKFPVEATTRWGILLILGIQLYFWLHLTEYRRRRFPRTDVAWIGAYPQLISRFVFFATSAVAPVAVVVFLLFFQREQTANRVLADLALLLSGTMAAFSWHEHRRSNLSAAASALSATSQEARSAAQGK